ncbi:hypothetical protein J7K74_03780 [Candidatus Woesearchaeota archaeon]|nr:hypothetical protein [Candidatus Woesearchaeota archaeon]
MPENPLLAIPEIKEKYIEFLKLPKEELALELAYLKTALERVDETTRYIISNMFMPTRLLLRNYQGRYGILMGARFEIKEFELLEDVTFKEYIENVIVHERKTSKINVSAVFGYEILHLRETQPIEEGNQYGG